jgi:hypothetical protein
MLADSELMRITIVNDLRLNSVVQMKPLYLLVPFVKNQVPMEHAVNECETCCCKGHSDG